MKRKLAVLLIAVSVLGLAACGTAEQEPPTESVINRIEKLNTETEELTETVEEPSETVEAETETAEEIPAEEEKPTEETSDTEETEEEEIPDIRDIHVSSKEDAELLLKARFGTQDDETEFPYSFGYLGVMTVDGVDYYAFTWSWLVDNDHLSRLTEVFVQTDGSAIYEGEYDGESCEFYTENMLDYE